MFRTTTLLIVTALAAGPVGALGCELWCASPAAAEHHRSVGCHDASGTLRHGPQLAFTTGCHDAAATTRFVTETRQAESTRAATTPVALFESNSIGADYHGTTGGWCVSSVPPTRPPSSRAVLRV